MSYHSKDGADISVSAGKTTTKLEKREAKDSINEPRIAQRPEEMLTAG